VSLLLDVEENWPESPVVNDHALLLFEVPVQNPRSDPAQRTLREEGAS
jgi:hypothetical protein